MKTIKKVVTIGVHKGYGHENNSNNKSIEEVYQKIAQKNFNESQIYVSVIIFPAKVIYSEEWGCPVGGEGVYQIVATANPEFVKDFGKWEDELKKNVLDLKDILEQSTVTIERFEVDLDYLT